MTTLTVALEWYAQQIAVIPIGFRSKQPDTNALIAVGSVDDAGKPVWKPYQERLPSLEELVIWFADKERNIAVVTGHQNLVILDIDDMALYAVWEHWAGEKAKTYKVKTSRGMHLYYFMQSPPERSLKWPLVDLKAAGGYCLADPSIHPSGHAYKALEGEIAHVQGISDILPQSYVDSVKQIAAAPCMCVNGASHTRPSGPWAIQSPAHKVKAQVRILDYFPHAKKTGDRWYTAFCPFHHDTEPSFWINDYTNRCGCFAHCIQGSIDSIEFYARLKGMDCATAIRELA